jgi:creatinine amidohydrolase
MPGHQFAELTWEEARALPPDGLALLPIGAIEAHGPHLPLATDVIIAEAVAASAAERLRARGRSAVVLPTLAYTAAPFAQAFDGTVSGHADHITGQIVDIARSFSGRPVGMLVLVNAHFDPAHLEALGEAVAICRSEGLLPVAYPDFTRRALAAQLGDEFASGACHAGRYEGSIVLAVRPDLVRIDRMRALPANPASLVTAIREGKTSFADAGGPEAYFGFPADATAEEGAALLDVLSGLVVDAADPQAP